VTYAQLAAHAQPTCSISLRLLKPFLSNCFSMTRALAAYESAISFYTWKTTNNSAIFTRSCT